MVHKYCDGISRRDALRAGVLGLTGTTLAGYLQLAHASAPRKRKADAVLFVNLAGGPSHLDTLDIKPNAPSETQGEFQSIQSKLPGLQVCEHLPKIAAIADQVSLIRGISHTAGAHPQGQAYMSSGNRPSPALVYPSYGSIVAKEMSGDPDLPPYIAIPKTEWNAGYLGDSFAPFQTNAVPAPGKPFEVRGISLAAGLTIEKVSRRQNLLSELDQTFRQADTNSQLVEALYTFGQQAHSMITSTSTREAFDVSQEPESIRNLFSADELGQSLLLGIRLIEKGVPFVTVAQGGWDTHLDNFDGHRKLLPPLDAGFTATLDALREKGLLERTLVIAMGEFGRTPKINANVGRDHYPRAGWCLMAGGGVRQGNLVGGTNEAGDAPDDDTNIKPDDIGASIFYALGIDHLKEYHTNTGRPVSLIPHGRVLTELFG